MNMKQCEFTSNDNRRLTAWIDEKFAKENLVISFKNETDRWTISKVHGMKITDEESIRAQNAYRVQRKASDI